MDVNKIFDNFKDNSSESDDTDLLVDFSNHPLYWIGCFVKIIHNHTFFTQHIVKNFNKISPDVMPEDLEKVGETLLYNRAWEQIKNINMNNLFHIECIKFKASPALINSLSEAIKYFESIEEYEKCILLQNILNKTKEFLP